MIGKLLQEICPALAEIAEEEDWEVIKEKTSNSFGDALVEMKGEDFWIQVIRDKGQISISLSNLKEEKEWVDLRTILEFLGEEVAKVESNNLLQGFVQNRRTIGALMSINSQELEMYRRERSMDFINKIFPSG
jgi:hypothetical protein